MNRSMAGAVLVSLALVLAACNGGSSTVETVAPTSPAPSSLPPVTTIAATTSPPTTATVPESTATTVVPDGVARLSDDGPWRLVDSAPGVTTPGLVYELMPKLWAFLPTEESDTDGNLYVPHPDDIPIIEAYLRATLAYFGAADQSPIDFSDPGWQTYVDGGESYFRVLRDRDRQRQYIDLDNGVLVRPRVLGDGRSATAAIVFDCTLDGSVWRQPDGTLAPGSTPGVAAVGFAASLMFVGERWLVEGIVTQAEAC